MNAAFKILPLLLLLQVSLLVGLLIRKKKWTYFPETTSKVIIGVLIGTIFWAIKYQSIIRLSADTFFIVLLPPIMFEAGFSMRRVRFFKNFYTILALAFIGTLFSVFISAFCLWIFTKNIYPLTFLEALVFGAIISATDPVSVLATLVQMPINKSLYILIFGESSLNDATSLIFFKVIVSFADPKQTTSTFDIAFSFFHVLFLLIGSALIGTLVGMLLAKMTKHLHMNEGGYEATEISMVFVFAYSSYIIAEVSSMSGIVSILFCGVAVSHYATDNISIEAEVATRVKISLILEISSCLQFNQ